MLYASHYFWTGLELRALVADQSRGAGFWLVIVNRAVQMVRGGGGRGPRHSADFSGTFVRRRVRNEVQDGAMAGLRMAKEMLDAR